MTLFDPSSLAEKASAVQRHLGRVEQCLPVAPETLHPSTGAADTVVLHLWQAVQIVIDVAVSACVRLDLGAPASYADAFVKLAAHGRVDPELARRLIQATGLRNRIVHAYEDLDLGRVHAAALHGPGDLRAFLAIMAGL